MTTTARRMCSDHAWLLYLLCGSAVVLTYYCLPAEQPWQLTRVVTYCVVSASAVPAVLYGVQRYRPAPKLPWLMIAGSQIIYALADASFYTAHFILGITTYPFVADVFYIAHYPMILTGIVLLIRHRNPHRDLPSLLDAAVLAVAAALMSWLYLIQPQVEAGQPPLATLASLAFPVFDLALFGVALRLLFGSGRRPLAFTLLAFNLAAFVAADTLYVLQQLGGSYVAGNFLDAVWLAGNIALGTAGLHPTMALLAKATDEELKLGPLRILGLAGAALVAPTILLVQHSRGEGHDIPMIAGACAVLFLLTISRLIVMVSDQRRVAVTDALTGLHTRRYFEADLPHALSRARRTHRRLTLLIIDIDHFKSINDRYGHPIGDRVLIEIAQRLRTVVREHDTLARYGGEEFALLVLDADENVARNMAERVRIAVSRSPIAVSDDAWVPVTVSVGAAEHSGHAPDQLVAVADRALYSAKARGRDRIAFGEPQDAAGDDHTSALSFLNALADRVDASLSHHVHGRAVGHWTKMVCEAMGCDPATAATAELAGRLHDVGKIVIPDEVLSKPAALDAAEWELLLQHPDHGHRLIAVVPSLHDIAEIVRQHHERIDGTGYPRKLSGSGIRFEARVVAVCDAFATMRSDRPYREQLGTEQALDELRNGCDTQFDRGVVEVFVSLHEKGFIAALPQLDNDSTGSPAHVAAH